MRREKSRKFGVREEAKPLISLLFLIPHKPGYLSPQLDVAGWAVRHGIASESCNDLILLLGGPLKLISFNQLLHRREII